MSANVHFDGLILTNPDVFQHYHDLEFLVKESQEYVSIKAHKWMVVSCSKKFGKLFLQENQNSLKMDDCDAATLRLILDWCYPHTQCTLLAQNVLSIMVVCEHYGIDTLHKHCVDMINDVTTKAEGVINLIKGSRKCIHCCKNILLKQAIYELFGKIFNNYSQLCKVFDRNVAVKIAEIININLLKQILLSKNLHLREDFIWAMCIRCCSGGKYIFDWQCRYCSSFMWKTQINDKYEKCNCGLVKEVVEKTDESDKVRFAEKMKELLPLIRLENFGLDNLIVNIQPVLLSLNLLTIPQIFGLHMYKHNQLPNNKRRYKFVDNILSKKEDIINRNVYVINGGKDKPQLVFVKTMDQVMHTLNTFFVKDNFGKMRNVRLKVLGQEMKAKKWNDKQWYSVRVVEVDNIFIKVRVLSGKESWWLFNEDDSRVY